MLYRMAAFTDMATGGNPAGVVLGAGRLTPEGMQKLAKEVGFSETAFVMASKRADFRLRFFTPVAEVDLCGHATVAAFNLMRELGVIGIGLYRQETKAGLFKIKVFEKDIYMEQKRPQFFEVLSKDEAKNFFKGRFGECSTADIGSPIIGKQNANSVDLPIQIVSTGLKDIIIPVKDLETLVNLKPDIPLIKRISKRYGVVGIHAFSLQSISHGDAHARNFAPLYGIDEEAATGTANGALACYLMKYLGGAYKGQFTIEQGHCMGRPAKIKVSLHCKGDQVNEVYVGGGAVII